MRFGGDPGAETKSCSTDYLIGAPRYMLWEAMDHFSFGTIPRTYPTIDTPHVFRSPFKTSTQQPSDTLFKLFDDGIRNISRLALQISAGFLDFKVRNNFSHSRKGSRAPLALQGPLFQATKSFRGSHQSSQIE